MANRVVVIGLDGATFTLLKPWFAEGKLPHLKRVIEGGAWGYLRSVIHPYSAPAWTSFMTGKNPGKHALFDFTMKEPGSYTHQFASSLTRRAKSLWKMLSEAGKRVCVLNVPVTYPPEQVNGYLVAGLGAPGTEYDYTYPPELAKELDTVTNGYVIHVYTRDYVRWRRRDRLLSALKAMNEKQCLAAKHMFEKEPYDFFIVVFGATDQVQHFFWRYADPEHPLYEAKSASRYGDAILSIYKQIDETIGWFVERLQEQRTINHQPSTIIVMSDHGFGGNSLKAICLNRWLCSIGMLRFVDNPDTKWVRGLATGFGARLLGSGIWAAKKWLPRKLKNRLRSAPSVRAGVAAVSRHFGVDFSRTKAYSDELRGNIFINVKGREPHGVVEIGSEYEDVRDAIIDKLKEMHDPETGIPIVGQVFKREEVYKGPYVELAPDILFLQVGYLSREKKPYNYVYRRSRAATGRGWLEAFTPDRLEWDPRPHASHRLDGIVSMTGYGIGEPKEINGAQITDLAPTILHLLGLPVPSDMDGGVLTDALDKSFLAANPVRLGSPVDEETGGSFQYSEEEVKRVEESLRALGYID